MRLSSSVVAAYLLTQQFAAPVHGFSSVATRASSSSSSPSSTSALFSEAPVEAEVVADGGGPRKKPLSPTELLAQVRKAKGLPEEMEEAPKLFSESLYDDMQNILLSLEKRVADGPGSLSMLEVEEFSGASIRVLAEMKEKEADRVAGRLENLESAAAPAEPVAIAAAAAAAPEAPPAAPAAAVAPPAVDDGPKPVDLDESDGPDYDGKAGFGMARGTTNTYVIPGMDEMSPEEYQKALQKSVSDRQSQRKKSGQYGNRQTWDYLNNLSGETGQLKEGA